MATGKFVSYLRVSTDKQGHSGLGIEAQRAAVEQYLNGGRWKLLREFKEVESGKRSDRPQLVKALELCKATGATLVIAKLDRLSRDAHFLLGLQKAGVPFVAADMPDANNLTVGIMALMAQHEREMISARTKNALAALKARIERDGAAKTRSGRVLKRLGNPNGARALRGLGNDAAIQSVKAKADSFAEGLAGIVSELRSAGITSVRAIADELNRREIQTPRGGAWHVASVHRLLTRVGG
jgi:DNA invertase Pin-like site-specific DNA recombinase